jgi:predicted ArsR family transcriptional regulator
MTKTLTATEQRVLTLLTSSDLRPRLGRTGLSARDLAARLDIELDRVRATAKRLVKAGLLASEIVREFDKPHNAYQSWRFGGSTLCVRRRAYYTATR